ncbi:MAG: 23S rRNA (adenine(1618)-N(6))-methyltransferase RlmF [Chitinophagales bacterium]|nr:23S rRNA (adenine(1618)-N(6))-methyltransferase RlmF [Chitinophagales bacterium]
MKKNHPKEKAMLHPRNPHRERYNFKQLIETNPALKPFVRPNAFGDESIDFSNSAAVLMLNKSLLKHFYKIDFWEIPDGYLCPPIPGRADYIHNMADLLSENNGGKIPVGEKIKCLDIGVGSNCIYPIIGIKEYGWTFVGSDIDPISFENANKIIAQNAILKNKVKCILQTNKMDVFNGIITANDFYDITICNPPFHGSQQEAQANNLRKIKNLGTQKNEKPALNFGGKQTELWCFGGEEGFIKNMIKQSTAFATHCFWFTTLVSKQENLKGIYFAIKKANATAVKTLSMGQGNKTSRVVAWTFLTNEQQIEWAKKWG